MSEVRPRPVSRPLSGRLRVPGDKSISHRAVLFASMAEGTSRITGVLDSADVRSTLAAATSLGADAGLDSASDGSLGGEVLGWGGSGPTSPEGPIDCGNSGTTARLLMGVLAGWPCEATLIGDASLSARPMSRVTQPLATMGARFESADDHLPVTVQGGTLTPISYDTPVASAQVKSALLLAGLRADGATIVREPGSSRDHTERMLPIFGVHVDTDPLMHTVSVTGPSGLTAADIRVPGDPSSAAFPLVAAAVVPGSDVTVEGLALNPTRTGFLAVLERMGVEIDIDPADPDAPEPHGTVRITGPGTLVATTVTAGEVPTLIDEIPILAVAAACARGATRFEGVGELRVKESDRLLAIEEGLAALGVETEVEEDTLTIIGGRLHGGVTLDSLGDHRLAMAWFVAGLRAEQPIVISGFEAVDVSYPHFEQGIASLIA